MNKVRISVIALLFGALLWTAFVWQPEPPSTSAPEPAHALPALAPSPSGGDFTLQGPQGPLALSAYRGRVVLIYFGYTFCPDVCPTSLAALGAALAQLAPDELAQVRGLFVTLDPDRDTRSVLDAYTPFFHPSIIGLGGSAAQIAEVAGQYGVRYMKQQGVDGRPYTIDHSSFTYVVARDGRLAASLPHAATPAQIVDKIRQLLRP